MLDARPAPNWPGMELINCIELPILIIDRDLTVTSFNTAAARLLSLSDGDHGKRLHSIQKPAGTLQIEELCEHVIATGSSHRMEVADGKGSRFSVDVGCHKADQNINGAVLTFTNVTAFRESIERAIEEREFTKVVLNTIGDGLVIVDSDLKIQAANQAFYSLFQTSRQESQGTHLYHLGSGDWNIPRLQALLGDNSSIEENSRSLECDLEFSGVGRRTLSLNARQLMRGTHTSQTTLITIQDITERKRAIEALSESEEELRILHRVGSTLASELDLKKLVQAITDAGRELSQAEFGAFFYNDIDQAGEKYLLYTLSGVPETAFSHFPMPRNTAVFGPTFRGEGTVRVADIFRDPRYGKNPPHHGIPAGHLPVRSYLAVPVISRSGEVIGGLFFGHSQVGVFTERAERLIEGIAKQAAIAMDNASLFDAMRNQRARAEESEEHLRLAQQVGTIGTFEWNVQTNVNRWTPTLEAIYGLRPGEFEGTLEAWQELLHPEDRDATIRQVEIAIQIDTPVQAEFRIIWPDGSVHWILGRWQAFRDQMGQPVRMTGVNIDITSRKEAEQVQNRLAAIVESSDDAIVGKDLRGIVTTWNPAAERMFGYSAKEMIGRSITAVIPPELHDDERKILETIGRGERIERQETVRVTRNGERLDVSLTISPVRDEAGRVIGAASIARDITQEKKTERALRMTERLASVGRMAATVAHEINNPLEAVTNLVYLAKSSAIREDVQKYLNSIDEELERIAHLTRQTLGFYRESKAPSVVRIGPMLDSLVSFFGARARKRGIEILSEIRRDPEIYAVAGEIRQVITNLVSNSIDAVGSQGLIRIRIDATRLHSNGSSAVRITVADSGPGIPFSLRSKLFEPFFTTKTDVGTGLGLWVCTNIVNRHHGSIRVKSNTTPGKSWTVFCVVLPSGLESANTPLKP
ncbi:PAS domain S-box protein [Terriglobus albidus]|uniref:PAS domain S-box protein n=1 Tax=Terriglobus albidus TaxID=1592106 RepID=UPI0021DFEB8A|nr:PAS domain S-box protein [Terriglobus albidus]